MTVFRFIRLEHNSFHMMQPAADTHSFTEPYGHIHSTNLGQVFYEKKDDSIFKHTQVKPGCVSSKTWIVLRQDVLAGCKGTEGALNSVE